MAEIYRNIIYRPEMSLHKWDGELLGGPFSIKEGIDHIPTPVSRPKLINSLHHYVVSLGIPINFGQRVVDYYEVVSTARAGAITEAGDRFEGDVVIAADGVGTKSWKSVAGESTKPRSSGFSVYRVAYPTSVAYQDPLVQESFPVNKGDDDSCHVWLGKNTHGIVLVSPEVTTWFLTHKVWLPVLTIRKQFLKAMANHSRTTAQR